MGNSASALPYSIGSQTSSLKDGWTLHEGSRKSDGAAVSVFMGKKPAMTKQALDPRQSHFTQAPVALHHFSFCKKLRHPHILQVYATLDTDNPTDGAAAADATKKPMTETGDWIVVTEPCVTLESWLNEQHPSPHELAWGLQCIIEALSFLHQSAKLLHGNVSPDSFFVTLAGDVKLWNFGLACPEIDAHFKNYEALVCPPPYRSPERHESRWDAVASCAVHVMDSYSLAILIDHLYSNQIPSQLQKAVQRLQTPNVRARPRLQPLLKCPVFDTPLAKTQKMLEQLTVQPVEAKLAFWQSLPQLLQSGTIGEQVARYKIFGQMKQSIQTICSSDSMMSQDMYRREVIAILPPLFFIAEHYLAKEADLIDKELSPIIARLFSVNDRGVRGALLGRVNLFVDHMNKSQLNTAVFEPMCSGFSDSSPALRELTLKATILLVPHLTAPNLEKLSRYLVRLQSDPETSIRTNTVIFICKLAPHLTDMNRQKMLLPSYVRAMKDGFEPCRMAALQSLVKSKEFFTCEQVATKVLPAVMPQLLDPSSSVRNEAFGVVECFMQVLREEHQRMASAAAAAQAAGGPALQQGGEAAAMTTQSTTTTPQGVTPAAPSSGGYLSGFSSWMTSSAKPMETPAEQPQPQAPAGVPSAAPVVPAPTMPIMSSMKLDNHNDFDDGWDDDDDDLDLGNSPEPKSKSLISAAAPPPAHAWSNNDEADFFSGFDSNPAKPPTMMAKRFTTTSSKGKKLAVPTPKKKPEVKKMTFDKDDDWDDF